MTLHGVDIYIWTPETPDLPQELGKFKLILISNRGTKIWPPPAPDIEMLDWPRCRYLCDDEVTHDEIDAIVREITSLGFKWTKCQKLFRRDGVDLFSQPY